MEHSVICINDLSKSYGKKAALRGVSFVADAGQITALVGNNGAGKTTLLRALLGLVRPDRGSATFRGVPYHLLPAPVRTVGAVMETSGAHPGRTGRDHLRITGLKYGLDPSRVDTLLTRVDLTNAADRAVRKYSFGMRQRLAIAHALLGDPDVLVLDEPTNGLDPGGIQWLHGLLQSLAAEGRTILVSSHHLAEVEKYMDCAVVLRDGELAATLGREELRHRDRWRVRSANNESLATAVKQAGATITLDDRDGILVSGMTSEQIGTVALSAQIAVYEITAVGSVIDQLLAHATATEED